MSRATSQLKKAAHAEIREKLGDVKYDIEWNVSDPIIRRVLTNLCEILDLLADEANVESVPR